MEVIAIKFNHNPNSAKTDALNIRKNENEFIEVPEWVFGRSVRYKDSVAAYAIRETRGNTITIKARFRAPARVTKAKIRAIPINLPLRMLRPRFANREIIKRTWIDFILGDSGFVSLDFMIPFSRVGVGIYNLKLKWQYRFTGNRWRDMNETKHRIYVVLEVPKAPWKQRPYDKTNSQLPWTEVLDYSCKWARGKRNRDDAAANITESVYNLGSSIIEYDCPGGGGTNYASPNFNCTAFLERLRGGIGLGRYVNCTDCATIASTFANILGCELWQSRMGYNFELNPILAIGSTQWHPGCPNWANTAFYYHEVAWKGACDVNDEVFDACLKVDGDDPTAPPHIPLLPVNMQFGNPGDLLYRDRLAAPAGRPNCNPQPGTRKRRTVV